MPGVNFNTLRAELRIGQVLEQLRFHPTRRSGSQLHGPCPVHESISERGDSLSINLTSGRYFCHKCHSHGNALELWAAMHKLSICDAALDICRALGREIPWIQRG